MMPMRMKEGKKQLGISLEAKNLFLMFLCYGNNSYTQTHANTYRIHIFICVCVFVYIWAYSNRIIIGKNQQHQLLLSVHSARPKHTQNHTQIEENQLLRVDFLCSFSFVFFLLLPKLLFCVFDDVEKKRQNYSLGLCMSPLVQRKTRLYVWVYYSFVVVCGVAFCWKCHRSIAHITIHNSTLCLFNVI